MSLLIACLGGFQRQAVAKGNLLQGLLSRGGGWVGRLDAIVSNIVGRMYFSIEPLFRCQFPFGSAVRDGVGGRGDEQRCR